MGLLGSAAALPAGAQARKAAAGASTAAAGRPGGATASASGNALYAERFRNVCANCHGVDGRSDIAGTPVLAGQHPLCAITQLFRFREGRRISEAIVALVKLMRNADLRGFSDFIGTHFRPFPHRRPPHRPMPRG